MSTTNSAKRSKTASLQELLNAAVARKTASDVVGTSTSSQATIGKEDKPVVEGERAKEHTAFIQETLGSTGTSNTAGAGDSKGDINPPMQASPLTGSDEKAEPVATSVPSGIDSGTGVPGATLGGSTIDNKVSAWRKRAAETLQKLSADATPAPAKEEPKAETKTAAEEPKKVASDFYTELTGGDVDQANGLRLQVAHELAQATQFGKTAARKVAAFLSLVKRAEEEEGGSEEGESEPKKEPAGEPSAPASAPAAESSAEGSPAPAAPEAGGMPSAGGGDNVSAVLDLLSQLSPEELQMVIEAISGASADPAAAGGMPPAADPMAGGGVPPEAMGGGMPPEAMGGDPMMDPAKMANLVKVASAIVAERQEKVKKAAQAKAVLSEIVRRGTKK